MKNKIHISQETADILTACNKGHWIVPREDRVVAKGKGELSTFWLQFHHHGDATEVSSTRSGSSCGSVVLGTKDLHEPISTGTGSSSSPELEQALSSKQSRLVGWNCSILASYLRVIANQRASTGRSPEPQNEIQALEKKVADRKSSLFDEVQDSMGIASSNESIPGRSQASDHHVDLDEAVMDQLRDYVSAIARLYPENPFHNFEHASHVMMSADKLLTRIVTSSGNQLKKSLNASSGRDDSSEGESCDGDDAFGISSEPLAQFAVVLSALVRNGIPVLDRIVDFDVRCVFLTLRSNFFLHFCAVTFQNRSTTSIIPASPTHS